MKRAALQPRQHALLATLLLAATGLGLALVHTRQVEPRLDGLRREAEEAQRRHEHHESLALSREAMDLPSLESAVSEARSRLRGAELAGDAEQAHGRFIDSGSPPMVAGVQALVSHAATESALVVHSHSAVLDPDPRFEGHLVRDLEVRGRFPQLVAFVDSLAELPYRLAVFAFDLRTDPDRPGELRAVLRYSL